MRARNVSKANEPQKPKTSKKPQRTCERCQRPRVIEIEALSWCHGCYVRVRKELDQATFKRKSIAHKGLRKKGHRFENDIADALREFFPNAKRQLEYQFDDCNGVDLANTGRYRVQCKRTRSYVGLSVIEEIECDQGLAGEVPLLVAKADERPILVALPFEHFLWLLRRDAKLKAVLRDSGRSGTVHQKDVM